CAGNSMTSSIAVWRAGGGTALAPLAPYSQARRRERSGHSDGLLLDGRVRFTARCGARPRPAPTEKGMHGTVHLTGGFGEDREFVFAAQPEDPEMRESVNAWIWDSGTEFGMPRIGVEAVADQWDTHDIQVNIATSDGRVFNVFGPGKVHDPR